MRTLGYSLALLLALAGQGKAHFVFIVPEEGAVKVIFSDTLKPDERVSIEKIENTQLQVVADEAKAANLKWTADKAFYRAALPAGSRIVFGTTDYGILQRGEGKPFWLKYHAKAIIGSVPASSKVRIGDNLPIELVPIVEGGKIRFQTLVAGKPQAKAEVSVMIPGDEKTQDVTTDDKGLTPAFEKAGLYGVRVRYIETKSGEDKGKKYEEIRHYATLVVAFK